MKEEAAVKALNQSDEGFLQVHHGNILVSADTPHQHVRAVRVPGPIEAHRSSADALSEQDVNLSIVGVAPEAECANDAFVTRTSDRARTARGRIHENTAGVNL